MLCDAMDLGAAHATAHCMRLRGLWCAAPAAVRKAPRCPRRWANVSLLYVYM